jgi:hypothetical protein
VRLRVIIGAAVLSLTVVALTRAWQQPADPQVGDRPGGPATRAQLIELRAALDLLELEHEAEKAHLLGRMQSMLDLEAMSPKQLAEATQLSSYFAVEAQEREWAREQARQKKIAALGTTEEYEKHAEQIDRDRDEAKKRDDAETIKNGMRTAKNYLSAKKADYLRHAREIAEKRLELAAAEKQYTGPK